MCFQDVSFISISSIWLRHRFQIGIKWFWEELIIKFVFGRSSLLSLSSSLLSLLHLLEWWMSPVPEMSGRWILSEEDTSPLRRFAFSAKTGTSFNHLTFFGKTGTFFGRWWVICTWLIACVHVLHTIVLFFRHLCWLNGSIHVIYTFKILLKLELRIKKIMSPKFWETILNKNTVNFYFLNVTRHQKILPIELTC